MKVGNEEVVDLPLNASSDNKIYRVPDYIRPKMTSYRVEVIFWGVRDMKKINFIPVVKPRIVIECSGVYLKSEVMENARKFCNFEETHLMVDLVSKTAFNHREREIYLYVRNSIEQSLEKFSCMQNMLK